MGWPKKEDRIDRLATSLCDCTSLFPSTDIRRISGPWSRPRPTPSKKGSKKEEESSAWRCALCSDELREPLHQRKVPATGGDDNEIHDNEHDVVAPAIRA